jgi:hypothetical protein
MGLQVQVWARRVSAAADYADDLPGEDLFSFLDQWCGGGGGIG